MLGGIGLLRDLLRIMLGTIPHLEMVEAVGNGTAAIEATDRLTPDVILMDIEVGQNAIYQELNLNQSTFVHPRVRAVLGYIKDSS